MGLGPKCMTTVPLQPGSIVTLLVSEAVWGRYDRIFGFGATSPRRHGSLLAWARYVLLSTRVPQDPAAGQSGVPLMWVPRAIPRF